jgi:hypothetical protein
MVSFRHGPSLFPIRRSSSPVSSSRQDGFAILEKKRAKEMSYEPFKTRKRCHAILWGIAHPLKALASVAGYLANGFFISDK